MMKTLIVLNAVQVEADAYVAIADESGTYAVNSVRCRIENVMPAPEDCGPGWREALLAGRIGHTRWQVRSYTASAKDKAAVYALGASGVGAPW